jgi:superoxide dismutase
LDYQTAKPAYLDAIWTIVNWKKCEERFAASTKANL